MDWMPDFLKGKFLQGAALGLLGGLVLFLILTSYEIRKFSALGFDIEIPDQSGAEVKTLRDSLEKATADAAQTAATIASAQDTVKAREGEIAAAKKALKSKDAEIEQLKVQAKSKPADTNRANQSQTEIATLRKERDALAEQVKTLTAKLRSASNAVAAANKKWEEAGEAAKAKSASTCGVSTEGLYAVLSPDVASWELLGGKIRVRLKSVSSLGIVSFYSNFADIELRDFKKGSDVRFKIDSCDYVLLVYSVDPAFQLVSVRFFAL